MNVLSVPSAASSCVNIRAVGAIGGLMCISVGIFHYWVGCRGARPEIIVPVVGLNRIKPGTWTLNSEAHGAVTAVINQDHALQ